MDYLERKEKCVCFFLLEVKWYLILRLWYLCPKEKGTYTYTCFTLFICNGI